MNKFNFNFLFNINFRTFFNITFIIFVLNLHSTTGLLKRCYSCRSRGELGNCKDPFPVNGTIIPPGGGEPELLRGVKSVPCASGWCGKTLEAGSDDYGVATQRMCLQRSPSDSEERCAYIKIGGRKVFVCFCKGDLCNAAPHQISFSFLTKTFLILFITRLM